ncbi:hypothetical protein HDU93_006020 [Gonapodya sp. JEL0774]|nr:hypothetical protein HDU93_006020 [Gonapodya sp. JEL0774]
MLRIGGDSPDLYIGVDVGTQSVRACIVDGNTGEILSSTSHPIRIWNPAPDFYHQSTSNIWTQTCAAVRDALATSGANPSSVKGVGFDATCSMAVLDANMQPVAVRDGDPDEQNVVLWMDHRATKEAAHIASTYPSLLPPLGGSLDPEHPLPKLAWLLSNLPPQHFSRIAHAVELPEWLCWRATDSTARSACSFFSSCVCERTGSGKDDCDLEQYRHTPDLWTSTGYTKLGPDSDYSLLGGAKPVILPPGHPVPGGLSPRAAVDLGLAPGTPVGMALIDAHAGWAGSVAVALGGSGGRSNSALRSLSRRMVSTCGTSACHYIAARRAVDVHGVWGPYEGRLGDRGWWLSEGGQGAVGSAIDHVLTTHSAYSAAQAIATKFHLSVPSYLNSLLPTLTSPDSRPSFHLLTRHLHVLPDFHGNRSPYPHPHALGTVSGIPLHPADSVKHLAVLYLATMQGLAYGVAEVVEAVVAGTGRDGDGGHAVDEVVMCGGLAGNEVWVQTVADVLGRRVLIPRNPESASLLGAAVLGAHAHHVSTSSINSSLQSIPLSETILRLTGARTPAQVVEPTTDEGLRQYHRRKRKVYGDMRKRALEWREWVDEN